MFLAVDFLDEFKYTNEDFVNLLKQLREKIMLLPQEVDDDNKYNSKYSGIRKEYSSGYFNCRESHRPSYQLTDEANKYRLLLAEINDIIWSLWYNYSYVPTDYLDFPFFHTRYYYNLKTHNDYFKYAEVSSYPIVQLKSIKSLADQTKRVLIPVEIFDTDLINFDSLKKQEIKDHIKKIHEVIEKSTSEKLFVMCHYRYINQLQLIENEMYDQIYWPKSLYNQKNMFEFSIVNNMNMYNMMMNMQSYFEQQIRTINEYYTKCIETLEKHIIELNSKMENNEVIHLECHTQEKIDKEYNRIDYYGNPKADMDYINCLKNNLSHTKKITEKRKHDYANMIKTETVCYDIISHSKEDNKIIEYNSDILDTPIIFSTKNLFTDDAIARIGLCFGESIDINNLDIDGLNVNKDDKYKKVKVYCKNF